MACSRGDKEYQPYPGKTSKLAPNMNLSLDQLRERLQGRLADPAYSYVLTSVRGHHARFIQYGSAPNFQGGLVTLCTCKHKMRTYHDARSWKKYWIVGFAGRNEAQARGNGLFYLMKVGETYDSQLKLWRALPEEARRAKGATYSKFGDVLEPRAGDVALDPLAQFKPGSYRNPVDGHVHAHCWENDVNYRVLGNRRLDDILEPKVEGARPAALLVGDPEMSFLWSRPMVFYDKHPRTKKWDNPLSLDDLLSALTC